jgi:hypothetical protein
MAEHDKSVSVKKYDKSVCRGAYLTHAEWTITIIKHLDPPTL